MSQPVPSFPVPAFADLQSQILADLALLPNADVTLRVSTLSVFAKMLAKISAAEFVYLAGLPNRALIPTLMAAPYLDVYCAGVGLTRLAATPAAGNVTFVGTNTIVLPSGSGMQNSNGSVTLTSTAAGTVSGNAVTVPVAAASGSAGNLVAGAPVTLLVGVAGINATGVVAAGGLTGGADAEMDDALQVRLAARLSLQPQGGAVYDYVSWAKLVPGVTRVWVYSLQYGPGTVAVQFAMDGRVNPVPLSADVAVVQAQINAIAPVIGTAYVQAPTTENVNVGVQGLTIATGYTLSAVQAAVTAAIAELNYTTTPGGFGWDSVQQNYVTGGKLQLQAIYAAIANTPGVAGFDLVAPTADTIASFGNIVQLAAPTWS